MSSSLIDLPAANTVALPEASAAAPAADATGAGAGPAAAPAAPKKD
jgi:hypothetical protein